MNLDEKNVKAVITDKVHIGKKCAIYNRLSISDDKQLILKRKELIDYCTNVLKIDNYVIFEEVSSIEDERPEFNNMLKRIEESEFTDILVFDKNRIYRRNYNSEIYDKIFNKIVNSNVNINSID